jgi:signal transduction histidine kinase
MGLGLPIVLGIAEGHGGSLSITSVPGEGTTLTMTLPRLEEATP